MSDIIVFDGICHLCNGWVQFLLKRDRQGRLRFAAMQGETGRRLLKQHGLNPDDPSSFLYFTEGQAYTDTEAIMRVLSSLGGMWELAAMGRAIPPALRNSLYRLVARHRYRLFGKREHCVMPTPQTVDRFLR